jgi:hypothetical protein
MLSLRIGCLYLLVIIFLGNSSCKKSFLDNPDRRFILRQDYIVDLRSMNEYMNGVYVMLGESFYDGYNVVYADLVADNIKPFVGSSEALMPHYNWAQQPDETMGSSQSGEVLNMNALWTSGYKIVRACNFILENVDRFSSENHEKAGSIKGQAYALRGLVHFVLVNVFSQPYGSTLTGSHDGIPYVTSSDWTAKVSRNSVAEVYTKIMEDLRASIPILQEKGGSTLVMNKVAAKALLARVALFKGDYEAAKMYANEVSLQVPIMNGSNYPSKLFTTEETEALFQLPPAWVGVGGDKYYTRYVGMHFEYPRLNFVATKDIAALLTENETDRRSSWVKLKDGDWYITKYPTDVIPGFPVGTLSYYQTVLRSSEMYLILAEAHSRLGNDDSARFYLDGIRKRANPAAESSVASGSALIDSIYKERRKELAFEGMRMFDLLRCKKGVTREDAISQSAKALPYPSPRAISPIPSLDVSLSGLHQNAGY